MSAIRKLMTCFIAASALALYGCGSDSKVKPKAPAAAPMAMEEEEPMEPMEPAGPTEEEITADAIAVAMAITADPPKKLKFEDGRTHDVNISHTDDDGLEISVVDRGTASGKQDDTEFDAADAPHTVKGWDGQSFKLGEETEYVTVYTNIEAPGPSSFSAKHSAADDDYLEAATDGSPGEVQLVNDQADDLADLVASEEFPVGQMVTYTADSDTDPVAQGIQVSLGGTFDGTPGEFACSGTGCSITTNADGELTALAGTWTFTPDDGADATVAKPTQADKDYLHFGYWLNSMENEGETSYEFQAFSGGEKPFIGEGDAAATDRTNLGMVVGTATYAGPAGGMYVLKSLMANGDVASATSGSFTADAELTANFGGPSVASDDWFSISGTVTDFMDGTMSLDGWSVDLKRANLVNRDDDGVLPAEGDRTYMGAFDGATTGGGTWSGQFFGTSTAAEAATGEGTENFVPAVPASMPSGVAGEFNGHFANGHVNGAFGAVKQ